METRQPAVRAILIAARARIADPERWTQRANARDTNGLVVEIDACNVQSWCAMGAVWAEAKDIFGVYPLSRTAYRFLNITSADLYSGSITYVNDVLGHDAVLAVFDEAIRRAGEQEV